MRPHLTHPPLLNRGRVSFAASRAARFADGVKRSLAAPLPPPPAGVVAEAAAARRGVDDGDGAPATARPSLRLRAACAVLVGAFSRWLEQASYLEMTWIMRISPLNHYEVTVMRRWLEQDAAARARDTAAAASSPAASRAPLPSSSSSSSSSSEDEGDEIDDASGAARRGRGAGGGGGARLSREANDDEWTDDELGALPAHVAAELFGEVLTPLVSNCAHTPYLDNCDA